MIIDVEALAGILRDAAKAEIMPRFRRLEEGMVREKSSAVDLVTEADEAAERMIAAAVSRLAPDALFVGEESTAADPGLLDRLKEADLAVVVDPVDGTFNFAAGMPLFGVMASVVHKGETVAGLIYDPIGDDLVVAEKGGGAVHVFSDGHSLKLAAAAPAALEDLTGMASVGFLPQQSRSEVLANLAKVRFFASYRCAAHEYRMAAGGFVHFAMYYKILPWDHLAGALIMQEAGAHVARFDGSAYLPQHTTGGLLIAPDKESWDVLRREVFTV